MHTEIDTIEYKGFTIERHYDDSGAGDPREWDNLGSLALFHRRYNLPNDANLSADNFDGWAEMQQYLLDHYNVSVIMPVWMIDHSGVALRCGSSNPFTVCDPGEWDSGMVGFVYVSADKVAEEGFSDLSVVEKVLRSEVDEYSAYLNGDVFGYVVKDPTGEVVDSCWGFIGESGDSDESYMMTEAKAAVDYHVENVPKIPQGEALFGTTYEAVLDWLCDRSTNDAVQEATGCTFSDYMQVRNGLLHLLRQEVPKYEVDTEG